MVVADRSGMGRLVLRGELGQGAGPRGGADRAAQDLGRDGRAGRAERIAPIHRYLRYPGLHCDASRVNSASASRSDTNETRQVLWSENAISRGLKGCEPEIIVVGCILGTPAGYIAGIRPYDSTHALFHCIAHRR